MSWLENVSRGLGTVLGGKSDAAPLVGSVLEALGRDNPDGLTGLAQAFKAGGLGHIVESWVSTGANLPVSGGQLAQVLGRPMIDQLAAKTGKSPEELTTKLAEFLPVVVDKLTLDGKLPESGMLADAIGLLRGKLAQTT
jgi:uncharacterized protein YidB (DUF937 family)